MVHFEMKKNPQNIIKLVLLAAAVLLVILYGINRIVLYNTFDNSYPEITFDKDVLEVSVTAAESDLFAGVSASDGKDGDVTDTLIVESISKMLESGERIVTYAAFDGDNHVGKAERRIRYMDYQAPRFSLTEPLQMKGISSQMSDVLKSLHAADCIDGDLTDQIVLVNSSLEGLSLESMEASVVVQVTNSCGDVSTLTLPVSIQMTSENVSGIRGEIELTEYLVYVEDGAMPQFKYYVKSVKTRNTTYTADSLRINTEKLDVSQPGVYPVVYTLETENAYAAVTLLVAVED